MKNVVVLTEDRAFALVSFPPRGIWQLKSPHPGNLNARGQPGKGGGGGWGAAGHSWNWLMDNIFS